MKRTRTSPSVPASSRRRISWYRVVPATMFGAVVGLFRVPSCTFHVHRHFHTDLDRPVVLVFSILFTAAFFGWAAHRTTPREPRL